MKTILILNALIFSFLFFSCGGAIEDYENDYLVDTEVDKFEGITKHRMEQNILDGGYAGYGIISRIASLNIEQYAGKTDTSYNLRLIYVDDDWLFIREEESLVLLIDNEKLSLSAEEIYTDTKELNERVYCREHIFYPVTTDIIYKMANAKNIDVKIVGKRFYDVHKFNKSNFKNFRKFIKEFIKRT